MTTKPQRWVSLDIKNVMGIKAVHLDRKGPVTTIGGKNGQGKSSIVKTLWMLLGGAASRPDVPLRDQAYKGGAELELTDYICKLDLSKGKAPRLKVTPKDGSKAPPPVTFLKALTAGHSFNPAAFYTESREKQVEILKTIAKQDTTEIDENRADLYEQRTEANRTRKHLEAQLDAAPHHEGAPESESTASELLEELKRRQGVNAENARARQSLERDRDLVIGLKRERAELLDRLAGIDEKIAEITERGQARAATVAKLEDLNEDEVATHIDDLETANRWVRDNKAHADLADRHEDACNVVETLTGRIGELDERKAKVIASTEFPVDGLGFGEGCVTYNGRPLDQACGLERLRVSVAIGAALNPGLRLLTLDDGEKLDEEAHANLIKVAKEGGYDLLIARVSSGPECDVIIEGGEIAGGGK